MFGSMHLSSDLDENIFSFLTLVWTLRLGGILVSGGMLSWMEFQQCRSVSKGISRQRAISSTLVEGRLRSLENQQSLWQDRCCPGPYYWTLVEVIQGEEAAPRREYCFYWERGVPAFSRGARRPFFTRPWRTTQRFHSPLQGHTSRDPKTSHEGPFLESWPAFSRTVLGTRSSYIPSGGQSHPKHGKCNCGQLLF